MLDCTKLGQILVLLINFADEEDIAQLIANCYPKITADEINSVGAKTIKEFLLLKLCSTDYSFYDYICEENIETAKSVISKNSIELLILHLTALQKGYNNFLILDNKSEPLDIEKLKQATQYKKGIVKLSTVGNIKEKEITEIINILVSNYAKYQFYYEFVGDKLQKLEVVSYKDKLVNSTTNKSITITRYDFKKTLYEIRKLQNYTKLINTITGKELKINGRIDITPFYINKSDKDDIKAVTIDEFRNINAVICEELSKDVEKEPCILCNPNKNTKRVICQNCKNLLDELKDYQERGLIDNTINFRAEIKNIKFGKIKTLPTLLEKRKNFLIDNICKLDVKNQKRLKMLINKSFGGHKIKNVNK